MQVEMDSTNQFPKFQVRKMCESWDIYIQNWVISGGWICYFNILIKQYRDISFIALRLAGNSSRTD